MPIFCRSRRVRRGRLGAHEKKNTKSLRPNIPPTISSVDSPCSILGIVVFNRASVTSQGKLLMQ